MKIFRNGTVSVGISWQPVYAIQAHKHTVMYSILFISFFPFFFLHSDKTDSHVHMLIRSLADAFAVTSHNYVPYKIVRLPVHEVLWCMCLCVRICTLSVYTILHVQYSVCSLCISNYMYVFVRTVLCVFAVNGSESLLNVFRSEFFSRCVQEIEKKSERKRESERDKERKREL